MRRNTRMRKYLKLGSQLIKVTPVVLNYVAGVRCAFPGMFIYKEYNSNEISVDHDPTCEFTAEVNPPDAIFGSPLSKLIQAAVTVKRGS